MLMGQLDIWLQDSIFYVPFRKRIVEKVITDYYHDFLDKVSGKTALEIGCGNGKGAKLIRKYFNPNKITATDLDQRLLDIAIRDSTDNSIKFEYADATKLKYKSNTFDAIFDFGVLHHIPNWSLALKELYRVLKPNGLLFLYDIPIESFDTFLGRIIKGLTFHPYKFMFREADFVKNLKEIGYNILSYKHYTTSLKYFVIVAKK